MAKVLDFILTALVGFIALAIILLIPFDTYDFLNNPDDYIKVYHLDTTSDYWQWQYLWRSILLFTGGLLTITSIVVHYRNPHSRTFRTIKQLLVYGLLILISIGLYNWYLTGFDH